MSGGRRGSAWLCALAIGGALVGGTDAIAGDDVLVLAADPEAATRPVASRLPDGAGFQALDLPIEQRPAGAWLLGATADPFCPTPSLTADDVAVTLSRAEDLVDDLQTGPALALLSELRGRLGCLDEPASAESLAGLHFLEAVAAHFEGDGSAAALAMRRVLAVRPGGGFDESYPPALREAWNAAREQVLALPRSLVRVEITSPAGARLDGWLDGRPIGVDGLEALVGEHLMQIAAADGSLTGGVVRFAAGVPVAVLSPSDASAFLAALDLRDQRLLATWIADRLGDPSAPHTWVVDGSGALIALGEATPEPLAVQRRRRLVAPGPPVLVAVGGGYARIGRWDYASFPVEFSFRIVGPLRVVGGARVEVGSARQDPIDPEVQHGSVLVPFGAGLGVRLGGAVHPLVHVQAQFAVDAGDGAVPRLHAGLSGTVGLELPLGRSGLALRPFLDVGFLGEWFVARGGVQLVLGG